MPLGCLLPGILCNDSVVKRGADDTTFVPQVPNFDVDIELGALRSPTSEVYTVSGDPTESCIVSLAVGMQGGCAVKGILDGNPRLDEIPFDSATKYMATLHEVDAQVCRDIIVCATNTDSSAIVLPGMCMFWYIFMSLLLNLKLMIFL